MSDAIHVTQSVASKHWRKIG